MPHRYYCEECSGSYWESDTPALTCPHCGSHWIRGLPADDRPPSENEKDDGTPGS